VPRKLIVEVIGKTDGLTRAFNKSAHSAETLNKELTQVGVTAQKSANAQVNAAVRADSRLRDEIALYRQIAASAQKGSREQVAAANLAARAEGRLAKSLATTKREARELGTTAARADRQFGRLGRGALAGSGIFQGLGRSVAFASGAFLGGAGLTFAIKSTIAAAEQAQVVQGQLANALENVGISFDKNKDAIDARTQALSQMSGFDDELITQTFTSLVRRTNDVTKALNLSSLAINVARGRSISLQAATSLVTKASLGMAGALRRVGIAAETGANATQLLDLLQRKFAGSAQRFGETAAGAQERFNVALENTQEIIGAALLPSITKILNKVTDWLNESKNQERIQRDVNHAVEVGTGILTTATNVYNGLSEAAGKFGKALNAIDKAIGAGKPSQKELEDRLARQIELFKSLSSAARESIDAIESARQQDRFTRVAPTLPRPRGTAFVGRPLTRSEQLELTLAGNPDDVSALREQRQQRQRALDFALKQIRDQKGNTQKFFEQAKDLRSDIAAITSRLTGIAEENAADAKRKADKIRDARKKELQALKDMFKEPTARIGVSGTTIAAQVRAAMRELERRAAATRQATQFRALGLTGTGDELAPTRKALQSGLAKITASLPGTLLDTDKNRNLIARIRKVLSGQLGSLSREVRLKIKDLEDALKGTSGGLLDPTKFRHISGSKFLDQLGINLNRQAERRFRIAFAQVGAGGMIPAARSAAFSGAGAQRPLHVHVNVDGREAATAVIPHLEDQQRKRERGRPQTRRGAR
jgi:hypothetical protein